MIEWTLPNLEETRNEKIDRNILKLHSLGLSAQTISKLFTAYGLNIQIWAIESVLKKGGA